MGDLGAVALACVGVLGVWVAVLTVRIGRYTRGRERLLHELSAEEVETLLADLLERVDRGERSDAALQEFRRTATARIERGLVAPALVRYNAFGDIAGNQSFSLALIDRQRDGIVLTALVGREGTRTYIRQVAGGLPAASSLSDEEQQALDDALSTLDTAP